MGVGDSRRGGSLSRLAGVHQAAWPRASGPMGRSSYRLARSHEAPWVSAIAGRVHPSCHLAASFSPYGRPPRPEGCILLVIPDTDHAFWGHPSPHTGIPLRERVAPIDHEVWSRSVDRGHPSDVGGHRSME